MRVDYKLVDVEASDDNTRIFHVFEMRIGINEFDQRIFFKTHFKYMENSGITIICLHIYGLIIDPHNHLLRFGLVTELVEQCTGIAEVRV